jgi:hypothetical protein
MILAKVRLINSSRITPQQTIAILASLIIMVMAFAGLSLVFNVFASTVEVHAYGHEYPVTGPNGTGIMDVEGLTDYGATVLEET